MAGRWIGAIFGFLFGMLFPPSSRERSIRLSVLVLLLLGIALAALAFKNINIDIPVLPELKRGGGGPLGLKLGLDLQGGGSLIYQADTGTRFNVIFLDPITEEEVEDALGDLRFGEAELALENFDVSSRTPVSVVIKTPDVLAGDDPRRVEFQETVVEKLGTIVSSEITAVETPTTGQMEGVLDIINRRVNLYGTEEPIIQRFGDDRVIVQLPGAGGSVLEIVFKGAVPGSENLDNLRLALERAGFNDVVVDRQDDRSFRVNSATASLSVREAAEKAVADALGDIERFRVTSAIDDAKALIGQTAQLVFKERACLNSDCSQFADSDIGLTGDDLSRAFARKDQLDIGWAVLLNFNERGSDIFSDLTQRISPASVRDTRRIAIFLDDREVLAPVALAWIRDGVTRITGNFGREEARTLAIQLESGRLPVPLKLIQENDVSALLGSESLRNSLIAGLVGLGLVIVFMVAYYRMAGIVASVALVFYAVVVLAVFKLIPVTLTLSHIGGFILSIGMAVDANVLIFERMKEEVRLGRTLASSMEVGFNRAWPAIRDGNISTLITCGVLLWFGDRLGGGLVTGFAISLGLGVLVSMFTAVVVSRNLLQLLAWVGFGHHIRLFTPEKVQRTASTAGGGR